MGRKPKTTAEEDDAVEIEMADSDEEDLPKPIGKATHENVDMLADDELDAELEDAQQQFPEPDSNDEEDEGEEPEPKRSGVVVNVGRASAWVKQRSIRRVVWSFKACVRFLKSSQSDAGTAKYTLESEDNESALGVVRVLLQGAPSVFRYCLLQGKGKDKSTANKMPHELPGFSSNKIFIQSFIYHHVALLSSAVDEDTVVLLLERGKTLVPYMYKFEQVYKKYVRLCLQYCTHDSEKVRVQCIYNLRIASQLLPCTTQCFKGIYVIMVRTSRKYNKGSAVVMSFLLNAIELLWGSNLGQAYLVTFGYLQQLASHVKAAVQTPSAETFAIVHSWSYLNAFHCLARVVSRFKELNVLVHPLVQIAETVVDLQFSPKIFPFLLHIVGILNRVQRATGGYMPVIPVLIKILESSEFTKKLDFQLRQKHPKPAKEGEEQPAPKRKRAPCLSFYLRAKQTELSSYEFLTALLDETLFLLLESLYLSSPTLAFAEFVHFPLQAVRRVRKAVKMHTWANTLRDTIKVLEAQRVYCLQKREGLQFGPSDTNQIEAFEASLRDEVENTPLHSYFIPVQTARLEAIRSELAASTARKSKRVTLEDVLEDGDDDEAPPQDEPVEE